MAHARQTFPVRRGVGKAEPPPAGPVQLPPAQQVLSPTNASRDKTALTAPRVARAAALPPTASAPAHLQRGRRSAETVPAPNQEPPADQRSMAPIGIGTGASRQDQRTTGRQSRHRFTDKSLQGRAHRLRKSTRVDTREDVARRGLVLGRRNRLSADWVPHRSLPRLGWTSRGRPTFPGGGEGARSRTEQRTKTHASALPRPRRDPWRMFNAVAPQCCFCRESLDASSAVRSQR